MGKRDTRVKGQGAAATADGEHEITSPRDAASGLASGKRVHKPMAMNADWTPAGGAAPTASQQAYGDAAQMDNLQMQMQMQMDRTSKQQSMLSNVMHEQSESADNVTDNLKK